jgi:hypothetical protein
VNLQRSEDVVQLVETIFEEMVGNGGSLVVSQASFIGIPW